MSYISKEGTTILHLASLNGHDELIKYLVNEGFCFFISFTMQLNSISMLKTFMVILLWYNSVWFVLIGRWLRLEMQNCPPLNSCYNLERPRRSLTRIDEQRWSVQLIQMWQLSFEVFFLFFWLAEVDYVSPTSYNWPIKCSIFIRGWILNVDNGCCPVL